jgi:hypothetical protein
MTSRGSVGPACRSDPGPPARPKDGARRLDRSREAVEQGRTPGTRVQQTQEPPPTRCGSFRARGTVHRDARATTGPTSPTMQWARRYAVKLAETLKPLHAWVRFGLWSACNAMYSDHDQATQCNAWVLQN